MALTTVTCDQSTAMTGHTSIIEQKYKMKCGKEMKLAKIMFELFNNPLKKSV